jgi:nucleoside-diphosphate-sugar epimerase
VIPAAVIIGCGYVGERLAARELARGTAVLAVVRTEVHAAALAAARVPVVCADLDAPGTRRWPEVEQKGVYYLVPPPAQGIVDTRLRAFLAAIGNAPPRRVVYLGTTGVYGDCRGDWVTEARPLNPGTDRARRRCDAEAALQEFGTATGTEIVLLRVPAIYGPGRLPLERLRRGLPQLRAQESPWSNRIHVDDLVTACMAAMDRGRAGRVYHVADGHPVTMTEFFNRVAVTSGLPLPPCVALADAPGTIDSGMLSYLRESRRIDNTRLRRELEVALRHPTLDSGLPASLAAPGPTPLRTCRESRRGGGPTDAVGGC